MYVILTSKPGGFHTEAGDGMVPLETWDYLFCGQRRATYVIAHLEGDSRIRVVDDEDASLVNQVPTKLLPKFDSVEAARAELRSLVSFGDLDARLVSR